VLVQPTAALHELGAKEGQVRHRASKCGATQAQKNQKNA
jgi:hypothetical protein